jgi:UDP-N-acetylglucosamine--N-acetylmuramyl-(pentapeptide) pyrophosphoryl-undecaprenol N-acetylglucosamine transferase
LKKERGESSALPDHFVLLKNFENRGFSMESKLHIAVACGGTGGHIFPGLATAKALRARGHHVTLWLAGKRAEETALQGWKGPVITIPSEGFQFGPFRSLITLFRIGLSVFRCVITMSRHRPNVVLAMGSYASIGPCLAARIFRIPYVLHEANAIPGRTVRRLAKKAAGVGILFEETRFRLKGIHSVSVGMPLRPELKPSEKKEGHDDGFGLLVAGGSAGAHALNELIPDAVCRLKDSRIRVVHLAGEKDASAVSETYSQAGVDAMVYPFVQDMAPVYEEADLAICRAGASTCAELGVFGVPALLIPYPHAASDHQTANALSLEKLGAADCIQQEDLTVDWLCDYLRALLDNPERLRQMRTQAVRKDSLNAADRLAELVETCAKK